jgi:hypothetical protein
MAAFSCTDDEKRGHGGKKTSRFFSSHLAGRDQDDDRPAPQRPCAVVLA